MTRVKLNPSARLGSTYSRDPDAGIPFSVPIVQVQRFYRFGVLEVLSRTVHVRRNSTYPLKISVGTRSEAVWRTSLLNLNTCLPTSQISVGHKFRITFVQRSQNTVYTELTEYSCESEYLL